MTIPEAFSTGESPSVATVRGGEGVLASDVREWSVQTRLCVRDSAVDMKHFTI